MRRYDNTQYTTSALVPKAFRLSSLWQSISRRWALQNATPSTPWCLGCDGPDLSICCWSVAVAFARYFQNSIINLNGKIPFNKSLNSYELIGSLILDDFWCLHSATTLRFHKSWSGHFEAAICTVLIGSCMWLVGYLRLARLVKACPFVIYGGFMAGTGAVGMLRCRYPSVKSEAVSHGVYPLYSTLSSL